MVTATGKTSSFYHTTQVHWSISATNELESLSIDEIAVTRSATTANSRTTQSSKATTSSGTISICCANCVCQYADKFIFPESGHATTSACIQQHVFSSPTGTSTSLSCFTKLCTTTQHVACLAGTNASNIQPTTKYLYDSSQEWATSSFDCRSTTKWHTTDLGKGGWAPGSDSTNPTSTQSSLLSSASRRDV